MIWMIWIIALYYVGFGITLAIMKFKLEKEEAIGDKEGWFAMLWPVFLPTCFGYYITSIIIGLFKKNKKEQKE